MDGTQKRKQQPLMIKDCVMHAGYTGLSMGRLTGKKENLNCGIYVLVLEEMTGSMIALFPARVEKTAFILLIY
jgi:hypothetical protein